MNIKNKVSVTIQDLDKVCVLCDDDCPISQLFDFACAFKSLVMQKMQESEAAQKTTEEKPDLKEG